MRGSTLFFLGVCLAIAACAAPQGPVATTTLTASDAATSLAVGERLSEATETLPGAEGDDPVVNLTLRHPDGRSLSFQRANHAPNDLFAQRPGGALAQIMGLLGEEAPVLYHAAQAEHQDAAFFCGPQGPAAIGRYEAADGSVHIVGLRQEIQIETRPDGELEAAPYSPDQVCARLRFRRN